MATFYVIPKDEDLQHYGILGMKWGVRRYQNADGSLTAAGEKRYLKGSNLARAKGTVWGNLLFGPVGGAVLGLNARRHQIQSNIEKAEREETAKRLSSMNDKELRDFNYRRSLENQLDSILSSENKNSGNNFVKSLLGLASSSSKIVSNITSTAISLGSPSRKDIEKIRDKGLSEGKTPEQVNKDIASMSKQVKEYNSALQLVKNNSNLSDKCINILSSNLRDISKAYNSATTVDTSRLSNKELQQLVDRMRMEQQYLNIVSPTNTSNGFDYVDNVVSKTADLTGVASQTVNLLKKF